MAIKQYFRKLLLPTRAQINSGKVAMFCTKSPIRSNVIFKKLTGGALEPPTQNRVNILTHNIVMKFNR